MKTFLVTVKGEFDPATARLVPAETAGDALDKYLREIESRNEVFREHVLDLAHNMTFVEQFYLSSGQELSRFERSGTVGTEEAIIKSRVRKFFAPDPKIGERFLQYMDTGNPRHIDDAVFEFIAVHDIGWRDGFLTLDLDSIESLR